MDNSERLFAAMLQRDFKAADNMIAAGATLDGDIGAALAHGSGKCDEGHMRRIGVCRAFHKFIENASAEDFAAVSEKLFELLGEPLEFRYDDFYFSYLHKRYYEPLIFETLLKCFNNRSMRKQATMQEIIDKNSVELLEICARYGWLKIPRIRDAVIKYSEESGKIECTAFLLEFKNRNFDLAAERAKAEKKAERDLNADPNSVTELRKTWRTKKLEDGTLEITSYKGRQTEVDVPEKIGKDSVTSIGDCAFSGQPYSTRQTPYEIIQFRHDKITKITFPETIANIGSSAFYNCAALKEVNIPSGVTVINPNVFTGTAVDALTLPETVKKIADYAFAGAHFKELTLPKGLVEIGKGALQSCDFVHIKIPPLIKTIFQDTFWRCEKLKEVTLPEGLETIKARAFWFCPSLEKINLPASIVKIENFKRGGKITPSFPDSPNFTAVVDRGSYAEKYCKNNNVAYKYKEDK